MSGPRSIWVQSPYFISLSDQDDKAIESPNSNHPRKAQGHTAHSIQCTVGSYQRRAKPVGARSWPLSPPSSSETHNELCYSSIPHTPSRKVAHTSKKMEHHISCEGSVIQLMKRGAFVEFNMAKWGKVRSSLLAARVTHITVRRFVGASLGRQIHSALYCTQLHCQNYAVVYTARSR
jgi:hypothetical protein